MKFSVHESALCTVLALAMQDARGDEAGPIPPWSVVRVRLYPPHSTGSTSANGPARCKAIVLTHLIRVPNALHDLSIFACLASCSLLADLPLNSTLGLEASRCTEFSANSAHHSKLTFSFPLLPPLSSPFEVSSGGISVPPPFGF